VLVGQWGSYKYGPDVLTTRRRISETVQRVLNVSAWGEFACVDGIYRTRAEGTEVSREYRRGMHCEHCGSDNTGSTQHWGLRLLDSAMSIAMIGICSLDLAANN
jgi:hypothetical protein